MQLGSLTGNDLFLRDESFEGLDFHSLSDDEEFVVVECKAKRRSSEPAISSNTTETLPETNGTPSATNMAHRQSAPAVANLALANISPTLSDTIEELAETPTTLTDSEDDTIVVVANTSPDTTETLPNTDSVVTDLLSI